MNKITTILTLSLVVCGNLLGRSELSLIHEAVETEQQKVTSLGEELDQAKRHLYVAEEQLSHPKTGTDKEVEGLIKEVDRADIEVSETQEALEKEESRLQALLSQEAEKVLDDLLEEGPKSFKIKQAQALIS